MEIQFFGVDPKSPNIPAGGSLISYLLVCWICALLDTYADDGDLLWGIQDSRSRQLNHSIRVNQFFCLFSSRWSQADAKDAGTAPRTHPSVYPRSRVKCQTHNPTSPHPTTGKPNLIVKWQRPSQNLSKPEDGVLKDWKGPGISNSRFVCHNSIIHGEVSAPFSFWATLASVGFDSLFV